MKACFLGLLLIGFAGLSAAEPATRPGIEALGWLAGRWACERDGRVIEEVWLPPAGGTMLGVSRTVKDGKTTAYEFVHLGPDAAGILTYTARPSGQQGASFRLVRLDSNSALFENPHHDFPQRIGYELQADGSLRAFIEGPGRDGKVRRIEFPYRRAR